MGVYRDRGDNPMRERQAKAAQEFVAVWSDLIGALPDDYGCTLTCSEAEAAAELWNAYGYNGDSILDAHAQTDDEGDDHYRGDDNS